MHAERGGAPQPAARAGSPGQRLRVWFHWEGDEEPAWHYGTVVGLEGERSVVEWAEGGQSLLSDLPALGTVEWLQPDQALELLERLEAARSEDLESALGGDHDAVLLPVDEVRQEFEMLRWMSAEIAERNEEMDRLIKENEELQEERARLRKEYEAALEESEGFAAAD